MDRHADTRIADLAAATRPLHWKETGKPHADARQDGRAEIGQGYAARHRARDGSPQGRNWRRVFGSLVVGLGSRQPGPSDYCCCSIYRAAGGRPGQPLDRHQSAAHRPLAGDEQPQDEFLLGATNGCAHRCCSTLAQRQLFDRTAERIGK